MMYLLLIVGFVLLIKGADLFVEGSSSIAKIFKIPSVIIGLTIVALGTSAPEAAVSITAGLAGNSDIALSNVLGSNLFNMLVVLGVCALIKPFVNDKDIVKRDLPVFIAASLLMLGFLLDKKISRIEGIALLILLIVYMVVLIMHTLKSKSASTDKEDESTEKKPKSIPVSIIFILIGAVGIKFGGDFVVDSACKIATEFGLSQTLIGLTIIAVGTSLPELVTSIVAALKGDSGLALGNAVGSNIMNILFILGIASTLAPITVVQISIVDTVIMLGTGIIGLIFCATSKQFSRIKGGIFVAMYIGYMAYAIMR